MKYPVRNTKGVPARLFLTADIWRRFASNPIFSDDKIRLEIPDFRDHKRSLMEGKNLTLDFTKEDALRFARELIRLASLAMTAKERESEDKTPTPEELLKTLEDGKSI